MRGLRLGGVFLLMVRGPAHRASRLVLTALAVASGVALVSGALLLADGTRRAYALAVSQRTNGVDVYVRGPETDRRQGISDFAPVANSMLATVKAVPGVRVAAGQVVRLAELASPQGHFYAAGRSLYGYSWPGDPSLAAYRLTSGRAPTAPGEAVVDAATAREAGLDVGSPVLAGLDAQSPRPATIVGLVAPIQSADLSAPAAVFVSAGWAQEMVGVGDSWDLLEVAAVPGVSADALRARVAAVLPPDGTAAITRREYIEAQVDALASRSQAIDLLVVLLAAGALLAAIATVFNTFAISLGQRREEFRLMSSVGLTRRQVYVVLVGEGLLVGLVASAVGAAASAPVAAGLGALVTSTAGGPTMGVVSLVPWEVAVAAGIGVMSTVSAAGWTALALGPVARRPALNAGAGIRLRRALAAQAIARSRGPVLVLGAAVAVLVAAAIASGSTTSSVANLVQRTDRADYIVAADSGPGVDPEAAQKLSEAPGIAIASEMGAEGFSVGGQPQRLTAIDPSTYESVLDLRVVSGTTRGFGDGDIWITRSLAASRGLATGDTVVVRFAEPQARALKITAVIADNGITEAWVIPYDTYGRGYHLPAIRTVLIKARPGVAARRLRSQVDIAVSGFPGTEVFDPLAYAAHQAGAVALPLGLINTLLVVVIAIALAGVVNGLALTVAERGDELGLLRILGMTRRQLWVMLQLESALVALAGAGAGSLLGLAIGVAAAWALEYGGLSEVVVPLPTLLAVVAGVVAAAAAGTALPAHRAGRLASAVASGLAE